MTKRAYPEDRGMPSAEALRAYGLTSAELEGIEILDTIPGRPGPAPLDTYGMPPPSSNDPERVQTPPVVSAPWIGKAKKKARKR